MLQGFILLPVGSLLYLPFLRLASRWLALERLSFGAAFQLGIMVGGGTLVAGLIAAPYVPESRAITAAIMAIASLIASSAICGYYVVTPEGRSVGMRKGFYLAVTSQALLAAVLGAAAGLAVLLFG
jgi:hypothetical protein